MSARDQATTAQVIAADPAKSTWLSANAGSGKTRVLTDRVARLLLAGVDPQKILCLTYTKAAASEMQNRLFKRLGEWAMCPDDELSKALAELGLDEIVPLDGLVNARRLFAAAIETPGGLKIQTIHSFCASILRRFPLEAGVSPGFTEMDERAVRLLQLDVLDVLAQQDSVTFDAMAQHAPAEELEKFLGEILSTDFPTRSADLSEADLFAALDSKGRGADQCTIDGVLGGDLFPSIFPAIETIEHGSSQDQNLGEKLRYAEAQWPSVSALEWLESALLTSSGNTPFTSKAGKVPTKATRAAIGAAADAIDQLADQVQDARQARLRIHAVDRAIALNRFAIAFRAAYDRAKAQRGMLDFDDLIQKTRTLLSRKDVTEWVLYKLDGGIDHVLVDEAQDTSPAQWDVIEAITREFTSGLGARDTERNIFVVGDKKQSIYSFQGAEPASFDRMRNGFAKRLGDVGQTLADRELVFSFRSAPAILDAVDLAVGGLAGVGASNHAAFLHDAPGRIDLWPLVEKPEKEEEGNWFDPVDLIAANDPNVVLAEQIATEISRMIEGGVRLPARGETPEKPLTEGDVLILVRRRNALFHEIIRACKAQGLNVAGADVLRIGGELAVKDIKALLSFLALPEDDLSLAAALKSPLFGWDEQMLFDLAHRRPEGTFLWQALRDRADTFPETLRVLDDLRDNLDFLRPFDLIERLLTRHDGRKNLLARLGEEAEDGINALVAQAMTYERQEVPSLTGFLAWLDQDDATIKRQADAAGERLRVMTVHGAKGLEAPVVVLPDTAAWKSPSPGTLLTLGGHVFWAANKDQNPDALKVARQAAIDVLEEERERLLYVAMTRAESWLIVCGAGAANKEGLDWHSRISSALVDLKAQPRGFPSGDGLRYQSFDWPARQAGEIRTSAEPRGFPRWLGAPVRPSDVPEKPVAPSDLGGAKFIFRPGVPPEDEGAAKLRGAHIHLLLEHLPGQPPDRWPELAAILLADQGIHDQGVSDLLDEASKVMRSDALAQIFATGALAEVSIAASLPTLGGRTVVGQIDRLLLTDASALVVDFKSNAIVPDAVAGVPEGLLRQMGAYAEAVGQVYPDKAVETAILWTRTATLMPLPHETVIAALRRAAAS